MSTEREEQLDNLEISMQQGQEIIELRDSMRRLIDSPDWKKMIDDNYFLKEASRLVLLKADPSINKDMQGDIDAQINAIGQFRQYVRVIFQMGGAAERAFTQQQELHSELLQEEAIVAGV